MNNTLLIVILITGTAVSIIRFFTKRKMKALNISKQRMDLYKKSTKTPFGSLLFLFTKVQNN